MDDVSLKKKCENSQYVMVMRGGEGRSEESMMERRETRRTKEYRMVACVYPADGELEYAEVARVALVEVPV
jgi:hypothetical protein